MQTQKRFAIRLCRRAKVRMLQIDISIVREQHLCKRSLARLTRPLNRNDLKLIGKSFRIANNFSIYVSFHVRHYTILPG